MRRVEHPSPEAPGPVPDAALVARLLHEGGGHLAGLPITAAPGSGSSNWVFRVGDAYAVRLPRTDAYAEDLRTEVRWLPRLRPSLRVPVPEIVLVGEPSEVFPRLWAVVSWVPGACPGDLDGAQQAELAATLGEFLRDLHAADTLGLPPGPDVWGYRCGEPVTPTIDAWADAAAADLADLFDPARVRQAWARLRDVPPATTAPCWVHTDLSAENLLVHADGRLAGVIDFGALGIGERSADLAYAWSMFDEPARDLVRAASGADDATWRRARARAFVGPGLMTIRDHRRSLPRRTARLVAMVEAVAAEVGIALR